ncbi:hypothetical protein [Bradyrhizobium sp. JR18.2]
METIVTARVHAQRLKEVLSTYHSKPVIYIVDAEKGGVGKTTVTSRI